MALITAILLAAGASRRFGGDKLAQALPSGDTVAVQACRYLLAASDEVVAVLRPHSGALAAQLQSIGTRVVICPTADQGMGTSLAFGVQNSPDAKGWLVALADMHRELGQQAEAERCAWLAAWLPGCSGARQLGRSTARLVGRSPARRRGRCRPGCGTRCRG